MPSPRLIRNCLMAIVGTAIIFGISQCDSHSKDSNQQSLNNPKYVQYSQNQKTNRIYVSDRSK